MSQRVTENVTHSFEIPYKIMMSHQIGSERDSCSTGRDVGVNDFAKNSSIPWQAKSFQTAYGQMCNSTNPPPHESMS